MRFTVSCDLLVPVLLEIQAESEDAAIDALYDMPKRKLLALADTEEGAMAIVEGSETAEVFED